MSVSQEESTKWLLGIVGSSAFVALGFTILRAILEKAVPYNFAAVISVSVVWLAAYPIFFRGSASKGQRPHKLSRYLLFLLPVAVITFLITTFLI